jgi:single-stranded-DNA-specific exonuclease
MPMKSLNKTIVKKGLQELTKSNRPAFVALKERFGFSVITEDDIGFKIAPLINCAGRMEDASIALEFLLAYDIYEANDGLEYLISLNEMRKQEQLAIFEDAKSQVDTNDNVIVVKSDEWNEGIVGIVAAKLCDKYKKPAFVFTQKGDICKGSARNNSDVNLYDLIEKVSDKTIGFGGHKGAAGMSVSLSQFDIFKKAINDAYKNFPLEMCEVEMDALCALDLSFVNGELFNTINSFRPFGLDNRLPCFSFYDVLISNIKEIGKNKEYKKLTITDGVYSLEVLVFVDIDEIYLGDKISFTATIDKNSFRDEVSYNLLLKEII